MIMTTKTTTMINTNLPQIQEEEYSDIERPNKINNYSDIDSDSDINSIDNEDDDDDNISTANSSTGSMNDFTNSTANSGSELTFVKNIPQLSVENVITKHGKAICKLNNIQAVADHLFVPVRYILTYLAFTLKSQYTIHAKTQKVTLTGNHTQTELQTSFDEYLNSYLYCKNCGLYEGVPTVAVIGKICNIEIYLDCRACGVSKGVTSKYPEFDALFKTEIETFEKEEAERVEAEEKEMTKNVVGLLDGKDIFVFSDNADAMIEYVRNALNKGKESEPIS